MNEPWFAHEKLDVYRLELAFVRWSSALLEQVRGGRPGHADICHHLSRAALSALLNTAEANGKRQRRIRAKFFDDARGSATECAACLDALAARQACQPEDVAEGKQMLARIVAMLTRLVERFSADGHLAEAEGDYEVGLPSTAEIESEGENEVQREGH